MRIVLAMLCVLIFPACGHAPVVSSEEVVKLCPPIPSHYLTVPPVPSLVLTPQAAESDLVDANERYDAWLRQGWRRVREINAIQQSCTGGND